jgi:hypothetical protein
VLSSCCPHLLAAACSPALKLARLSLHSLAAVCAQEPARVTPRSQGNSRGSISTRANTHACLLWLLALCASCQALQTLRCCWGHEAQLHLLIKSAAFVPVHLNCIICRCWRCCQGQLLLAASELIVYASDADVSNPLCCFVSSAAPAPAPGSHLPCGPYTCWPQRPRPGKARHGVAASLASLGAEAPGLPC